MTFVAFFSTLKMAIYADRFSHFLLDFNFPCSKITVALRAGEAFWMVCAETELDSSCNDRLLADGAFFANFDHKAFLAYKIIVKFIKLSVNQPSLTHCTLKAFSMPGTILVS